MDFMKMPVGEVLTEDERLVADFIKTRTDKVLADIQQLTKDKNEDLAAWSKSFSYLNKTYGRDSDETFKWYKYYFREGLIPASIALPLLIQVYLDGKVDGGFVNILTRAMKQEPEQVKSDRIDEMKQELAAYIGEDGKLTVFRGSFEQAFGQGEDASRSIEKGYTFSLDKEVAHHYACCWFPKTAKIYEVKADLTDVAWYSNYDDEKMVMLLPQSKGGTWEVVSETVVPAEEYNNKISEREARASYRALFM